MNQKHFTLPQRKFEGNLLKGMEYLIEEMEKIIEKSFEGTKVGVLYPNISKILNNSIIYNGNIITEFMQLGETELSSSEVYRIFNDIIGTVKSEKPNMIRVLAYNLVIDDKCTLYIGLPNYKCIYKLIITLDDYYNTLRFDFTPLFGYGDEYYPYEIVNKIIPLLGDKVQSIEMYKDHIDFINLHHSSSNKILKIGITKMLDTYFKRKKTKENKIFEIEYQGNNIIVTFFKNL